MKNYTQVYVKNSFEAAEMYCKYYITLYYYLLNSCFKYYFFNKVS